MTSQGTTFALITILILAVVLCIFAMKYYVAARSSGNEATRESELKKLAEVTSQTQFEMLASLKDIRNISAELKTRITTIEKVLREVD